MTISKLPNLIYNRRHDLGITQVDLINRLVQYGTRHYSLSIVSQWENGQNKPPINKPGFVTALAKSLDVSESEILAAAGVAEDFTDLPPGFIEKLKQADRRTLNLIENFLDTLLRDQEDKSKK